MVNVKICPQYVAALKKNVVPEMSMISPDGLGIFHQDLAPCHEAKTVKNVFQVKGIDALDWLGNSPYLNLIENKTKAPRKGR